MWGVDGPLCSIVLHMASLVTDLRFQPGWPRIFLLTDAAVRLYIAVVR
jgi:hypothetical protein